MKFNAKYAPIINDLLGGNGKKVELQSNEKQLKAAFLGAVQCVDSYLNRLYHVGINEKNVELVKHFIFVELVCFNEEIPYSVEQKGKIATNFLYLFGNIQHTLIYIQKVIIRTANQPCHDAFLTIILPPKQTWCASGWKNLLLKEPQAAKYLPFACEIEVNLGRVPISSLEAEQVFAQIGYQEAFRDPQFAAICLEHKVPEHVYTNCINTKLKEFDYLPEIYLDGNSFGYPGCRFYKLHCNDRRSLIMGYLTGCCQSLGSAGAQSATHSATSYFGAVYVLEEHGKIIAQLWTWINSEGVLVFDSWERVERDNMDSLCYAFLPRVAHIALMMGYKECYIGRSGHTPWGRNPCFLKTDKKLEPVNYRGYRDSKRVMLVTPISVAGFHLPETPDLMTKLQKGYCVFPATRDMQFHIFTRVASLEYGSILKQKAEHYSGKIPAVISAADLSNIFYTFAGKDLENRIFHIGCCLSHCDFSSSRLVGAVLKSIDLSGANLSGAYLTDADLTNAGLRRANLTKVDLGLANLTGANLTDANLTGANLTGANLTGADLTGANLTWANLTGANLTGANLRSTDLTKSNLTNATLIGADLFRANLAEANLFGITDFDQARLLYAQHASLSAEKIKCKEIFEKACIEMEAWLQKQPLPPRNDWVAVFRFIQRANPGFVHKQFLSWPALLCGAHQADPQYFQQLIILLLENKCFSGNVLPSDDALPVMFMAQLCIWCLENRQFITDPYLRKLLMSLTTL
jgi:uncharacterized protein YjbI with pentapeptide repeats